jgi:hypothetical protein
MFLNPRIQQEVLNATQLSLHCMDIVVDGASLAQFQRAAISRWASAQDSTSASGMIWFQHMDPLTEKMSPAARNILDYQDGQLFLSLCELLFLGDLHVTKPQDRLYALMHLAKDYKDGEIVVDYGKTGLEVLVEAAALHVRVHRDLRFLSPTYLRASNNGYKNRDERLQKPTWLPQAWLGEYNNLQSKAFFVPRTTKCLPDTIATASRRLRIRGMKVDYVRSCLIDKVYNHKTPRQFWDSLIGCYLRNFAGMEMRNLSDEAFATLFGSSEYDLSKFATRMKDLDSSKSSIFQNCSWGQDEDNDQRMFVTMKKAAISGLDVFLQLSQDSHYADRMLFSSGELNTVFFGEVGPTAYIALERLFQGSSFKSIIMTQSKKLGRIPECDFEKGDEIWIVLGIDEPLVLRPQPNGYYWHICATEIPSLQGHADIRNFSSDVQPGDKIGDWVVEDVELE